MICAVCRHDAPHDLEKFTGWSMKWCGDCRECRERDEIFVEAAVLMLQGMDEDAELIVAELGIDFWAAWDAFL